MPTVGGVRSRLIRLPIIIVDGPHTLACVVYPYQQFRPPLDWSGESIDIWSAGTLFATCNSLFIRYNSCMAITRRQKEVIDFLSGFTQKNGYSPSYEEIATGLGLNSLATVHKHITNLQNKGLLQRAHNRSRSIDVLPPRTSKKGFERLPLLGRIAAGRPVEAIETAESISLGDIIGNREVFALEVRGDSMRDEHIVSGDYVLVERTRTAREGEIVVALIDGADATLKRFYREGSMIRLQPSNASMAPIYVPAANVTIQGKVLGILRKYS